MFLNIPYEQQFKKKRLCVAVVATQEKIVVVSRNIVGF
jgi:hypothetical protein